MQWLGFAAPCTLHPAHLAVLVGQQHGVVQVVHVGGHQGLGPRQAGPAAGGMDGLQSQAQPQTASCKQAPTEESNPTKRDAEGSEAEAEARESHST